MGAATGIAAGVGVAGSLLAGRAATRGAQASERLLREQAAQTREDFDPYLQAGYGGLADYQSLLDEYNLGFEQFDFEFDEDDPSYQFRFQEGQRATDRAAAARGGLVSGGRLAALQERGQQAASQEYAAEFSRDLQAYQVNQAAQLDRIGATRGLADYGIQAATGAGQITAGLISGAAQSAQAAGQARAAGIQGASNTILSGISDYAFGRGSN